MRITNSHYHDEVVMMLAYQNLSDDGLLNFIMAVNDILLCFCYCRKNFSFQF